MRVDEIDRDAAFAKRAMRGRMQAAAGSALLSLCVGGIAIASASAAIASQQAVAPTVKHDRSLQQFWTKFRKAALANDAAAIAALSAPVVEQHGTLDDSPQFRLSPRQVAPVLAKLLETPDGVDPQGRSHRRLLEAATAPAGDRNATATDFRFGDMMFARGPAGWRLVRIYYEPDD